MNTHIQKFVIIKRANHCYPLLPTFNEVIKSLLLPFSVFTFLSLNLYVHFTYFIHTHTFLELYIPLKLVTTS